MSRRSNLVSSDTNVTPVLRSTTAKPPNIGINPLVFAYGQQPVLQHIHLHVDEGTTLGLIGPNGGGKTTLMRLMLGLNKPTVGEIRVAGLRHAAAVRAGNVIGYLP